MDAKKNRHFKRILGKTVVTVVLIICGISCLLPLAWMISTSFKPELDVFEYPIRWIPKRWNFNTYKTVFTDDLFPIYFLNSAKVTFFSVVGNVFFSALAGYAFARLRFKGRNVLFIIYLATMIKAARSSFNEMVNGVPNWDAYFISLILFHESIEPSCFR